jgi:hypothetical protein
MAGARRESGSTDMHLPVDPQLDPVLLLLLLSGLGTDPVLLLSAQGTEFDPKDTPLVLLSTSRWTDLRRNTVRPEIVSMG